MLKMHQKRRARLTASGSEFVFRYPKIDSHTPKGVLISVLKKKITEAQLKANERKDVYGETDSHYQDLRIAIAYAGQRLKEVIDRDVERILEREEITHGIRALEHALRRC